MEFSDWLKSELSSAGVSSTVLGERLGVSPYTVLSWRRGQSEPCCEHMRLAVGMAIKDKAGDVPERLTAFWLQAHFGRRRRKTSVYWFAAYADLSPNDIYRWRSGRGKICCSWRSEWFRGQYAAYRAEGASGEWTAKLRSERIPGLG